MGAVGGQQRLAATPAARAAAVQSLLLAQRVLMLDDVWTMEVERATGRAHELTESDIEVLEGHVRHLQRSLEETPMRARELRLVLEEMTGDDVDAGLAAFADSPATPPDLVARVERSLPDYDLRSAAIEACDYLIEEVEEDIRLLEQQLHTLRAEQLPPGHPADVAMRVPPAAQRSGDRLRRRLGRRGGPRRPRGGRGRRPGRVRVGGRPLPARAAADRTPPPLDDGQKCVKPCQLRGPAGTSRAPRS